MWLGALGLAAACGTEAPAPLLIPEGAHSLFLVRLDAGAGSARLVDLRRGGAFDFEAPGRTTASFYERSLPEWALPEGEVALGATGRALEPFSSAFQLDDEADRWRAITTLEPALSALRLPAFDPVACVDMQRCVGPEEDGDRWCEEPCPPPSPTAPAAPEPPRPQARAPCPEGWSRLELGDFVGLCRPPDRRDDCAPGQVQWLGRESCERIGDPCPAGRWPTGLLGRSDVVYVDASAVNAGDGSEAAPFLTLDQALAAVPTTATIALAAGSYRTSATPSAELVVVGACVEETVLEAEASANLLHAVGRLELRNLTLSGGRVALLATGPQAELHLRDLEIRGDATSDYAIWLRQQAHAVIHRVAVRGRPGLRAEDRSEIEAFDFVGEAESAQAMLAFVGASRARLHRLAVSVREVLPLAAPGVILDMEDAELELNEAWVEHGQMNGLWVVEDALLTASDLWVVDRRNAVSEVVDGHGLYAAHSSSVTVQRVGFDEHKGQDVVALDQVTVNLDDVVSVVSTYRPVSGFIARDEARLRMRRAFVRAEGSGLDVFLSAHAEVEDLVLETRLRSGALANGVVARGAANLVGRRWRIDQRDGTGIIVDELARAELSDLSLRGTTSRDANGGFAGVFLTGGPSQLHRVHVDLEGQRGLAIKSAATLEDVRVEGELGFGLRIDTAEVSEEIRGTRVSVSTRAAVGLEAIDRSYVVMRDLRIAGGRLGVNVSETAELDLEAFVVQGVRGRGIVLFDDAVTPGAPELRTRGGRIESCELGVSMSSSVDAASILEGLSFESNGQNARISLEP